MRLLVTAGPTREFFDSVRFLSNPSTGKMGYAIAREAATRGHRVALVSGPVALPTPRGMDFVSVVTAEEMHLAVMSLFGECQACVMTAAVCDYRPSRRLDHKLKKQPRVRAVRLRPTRDICADLGRLKQHRVLVGFAMEDHRHHQHAEEKLRKKRCDAIVLNGIDNVAADAAEIEILRADTGWAPPVSGTKIELAPVVIDLVEALATRCRSQTVP